MLLWDTHACNCPEWPAVNQGRGLGDMLLYEESRGRLFARTAGKGGGPCLEI